MLMQQCRNRLSEDELRLVENYASLTPECKKCIDLMMIAAVEKSAISATIIDFATYAATKF